MAASISDIQKDDANRFASSPESTEKATSNDVPPSPPNGGLDAWLRVFAAFLIFVNTW
jgi:hypothetical protein